MLLKAFDHRISFQISASKFINVKYTHLLASFCTLTIISTHPLIDHEHESPIEVREAAAAPAALAST